MASWNNKLPDTLTNAECERGDVTKQGGTPPVRIVPPKKKDEDSTSKKSTVTFYVGENQDVKETYEKFDGSNPEEGIQHVKFFLQFIEKKGTVALIEEQVRSRDNNTGHLGVMEEDDVGYEALVEEIDAAKAEIERLVDEVLNLFEQLLSSALVTDWNSCCRKALDTPGFVNENDVWINHRALGKIGMPSINACLNAWLRLKVPKDCAERHRRYNSTQLVFPLTGPTKGVKIKPFLLRIKDSNDLTPYMPCLKDTKNAPASMPRANVPFPEYELCIYMLNTLPRGLSEMYWARKGEHFPCKVDQLIEDLHMMEPEYLSHKKLMGDIRAIKQAAGTSSPKASDKKSGSKRKMSPGDSIPKKDVKRTPKLCQHCAQWAPQIKDTHNTKDCRKWNPDGTSKQKGRSSTGGGNYKGSNAHSIDEMKECFATMKKQNEKLMKYVKKSKKSRRGRRGYASSDSDSDSE